MPICLSLPLSLPLPNSANSDIYHVDFLFIVFLHHNLKEINFTTRQEHIQELLTLAPVQHALLDIVHNLPESSIAMTINNFETDQNLLTSTNLNVSILEEHSELAEYQFAINDNTIHCFLSLTCKAINITTGKVTTLNIQGMEEVKALENINLIPEFIASLITPEDLDTVIAPPLSQLITPTTPTTPTEECPVCLDHPQDYRFNACQHGACQSCIVALIQTSRVCPICRAVLY